MPKSKNSNETIKTSTPPKENILDEKAEIKEKGSWSLPEFPRFVRIFFAFLANTLTFLNFASGIIAIILVSIQPRNYLYCLWAAKLVLLAIIFDFSDGIPARLANKKPGFFGTVVDSLADIFSFGFAPAVMISLSLPILNSVNNSFLIMAIFSIIIGCYFGLCTTIRLIRFTKTPSKKWFQGIPSPGAGCAVAIYIIIKLYIEEELLINTITTSIIGLILLFITATLMIVKIRYPTTKLRKNFLEIFLLGLAAVTIITIVAMPFVYIIYPVCLMGALTIFYISYGPFYLIRHMLERASQVEDY